MAGAGYFDYSGENTRNVVFPLGGIGAGCIGIGGDGRLRDWEIFNRPSKGSVNGFSHFAVRAEQDGKVLDTRVLHGPFQGSLTGEHLGKRFNSFGFGVRREHMAGFPSFAECQLSGPYPVATLTFADPRFPGAVQMDALSPFLPMESRLSSLPTAMFEVSITNTTEAPMDYTLFGCLAFDFVDDVVVAAEKRPDRTTIMGRSLRQVPRGHRFCFQMSLNGRGPVFFPIHSNGIAHAGRSGASLWDQSITRGWHLDIIQRRDVERAISADPEIRARSRDQRFGL